jgi:hypothetical protein
MAVMMAATLAIASLAHAQKSLSRDSLKDVSIDVRGCVKRGIDRNQVVLDHIVEMGADGKALPPVPRGLPTAVYSFNHPERLLAFDGRMVEIRGRIKNITDSIIEIKPGPTDDAPIADIHRPGLNVHASLDDVPLPVATAGTNTSIQTVVLTIDLDDVKGIAGSCAPER